MSPVVEAVWQRVRSCAPLAARILGALLGGYALAALTSLAVLQWPGSPSQTVLSGMMLSFLVYAAAVIWVFAARSAWRAWCGLLLVAVPLGVLAAAALLAGGAA